MRDGRPAVVPAAEVVPGDVLLLEAGDVVAADARLIEAHALATNEAPLTGESLPVDKTHRAGRRRRAAWPSGTTPSSWGRRSRPARAGRW